MSGYRTWIRKSAGLVLLALIALPAAAERDRAKEVLTQAKLTAGSIKGQADALTRLAWPEGPVDSEVAAAARADLIDFGHHSLGALRQAMRRVDATYTADVTATLIQARQRSMTGIPADFLPALDEAVWRGSPDAQRLAIPVLAQHQFGPALMACIDAAIEHPGLTETVLRALAVFKDHRARYYLTEILLNGSDEQRPLAANALAQTGGLAMTPLRDAVFSEDAAIRLVAIRALIPVSRIDDLTLLYEYAGRFPDDGEPVLESVRERTALLESLLEQVLDEESASTDPFD
jgi:hypothetical protein